uniref:Uncharacterized protein n=1 Tax=Eutreptiella gymnastica TaxID=73025 RepID=A0A7S4G2K6_9EUGL
MRDAFGRGSSAGLADMFCISSLCSADSFDFRDFADSLRKLPNSWNTHPQLTEHLWLNMVCLEEHCIHTGLQPQWCANWNYDWTALPWYTAQPCPMHHHRRFLGWSPGPGRAGRADVL